MRKKETMAAKSDFAQKLLNDLRMRKERMAASQGSTNPNSMSRDSYRSPGQTHKGSRQIKALESSGSKTGNQRLMSSGGGRPLDMKELSQQIVSYSGGRHGRSESIGDLSVAFGYALKNGGKVVNLDISGAHTNTMIDFLQQIGRRSLDVKGGSLVKHHPSNGSFPALTNIQIKEIAKGVQNLNQILKASSNGMNFDKYSMEVGRQLLKGAKGLEESLKMLVNLQEASEYMIPPQRKSRITLLEVDEDDKEDNRLKIADQKQVNPPRFSFDRPKKSHSAVTDETDASKLITHQRSASCGADSFRNLSSTALNTKNSSSRSLPSKPEKGRISNVIAKLMGLEEIPGKLDKQNESSARKIGPSSSKIAEPTEKQVINKISPTKDAALSLKFEKSQPRKDFYEAYAPGPKTSKVAVGRQERDTGQSVQVHEKRKNEQEKERAQRQRVEVGEKKEEKMQQKQRSPEVAVDTRHERVEKKKLITTEKSNEIRLIPGNNQKQKSERRAQKISKQESEHGKHNQSEKKQKVSSKPLDESKSSQKDLLLKEPSIQPSEENLKATGLVENLTDGNINEKVFPRQQEVKVEKKARKKVDAVAVHTRESPRKRDEILKRRNGSPPSTLGRPSKHKLPIMQEIEKGRLETKSKGVEQLKGDEKSTVKSRKSELVTKQIEITDESELSTTLIIEAVYPSLEDRSQNTMSEVSTISDDHKVEALAPVCKDEPELKSLETSKILLAGVSEGSIETRYLPQNKPNKSFYSGTQVVLTEPEKQLKEILMKDQLFLNTAEALFKLNIPVGILHADDHTHHSEETKLKLDCGYEIMRRKARTQELAVYYPHTKVYVSKTTIRYLDELVKQLYKDLESLALYGRKLDGEFDAGDCLHNMLEKDVQNKCPDINSFWDFGWNGTTFAFVEKDEFTKDVEQFVLGEMIDEITEDLLSIAVSSC